jgi:hypothetical protein
MRWHPSTHVASVDGIGEMEASEMAELVGNGDAGPCGFFRLPGKRVPLETIHHRSIVALFTQDGAIVTVEGH